MFSLLFFVDIMVDFACNSAGRSCMAVRDVHIMPSKRFNLHSWRSDGLKLSLMVAMLMAFGGFVTIDAYGKMAREPFVPHYI